MDENSYPYRPPYQNPPPPYQNQQYGPQYPQNLYPFPAPNFQDERPNIQDVRPNFNYNIPPQNMPNYSGYNYSPTCNNSYSTPPPSIPYQNPSQSSVYNYYGNYYNLQNTVTSNILNNPPNSVPYPNTKPPEKDFSQALDEYKKDRRTLEQKKETKGSADRFRKSYDRYSKTKSRSYDRNRRSSRRSRTRSLSRVSTRSSRRSRSSSRHHSKRRSRSMSRMSVNSKLDQRNRNQNNTRSTLEIKVNTSREHKQLSERESLLAQYRKDYCATSEEMSNKLEELSKFSQEETIEREKLIWFRTTPADLYYARDDLNPKIIRGTSKLQEICDKFNTDLVLRSQKVNVSKPKYEPPQRKKKTRLCKHKCTKNCK